MSIKYSKGYLMSGQDYKLTESITLHHPSMREIFNINNGVMSEQIYWSYASSLMCDPYNNMVMLDDMGKNFMEVAPFDVLILTLQNKQNEDFDSYHSLINNALKLFIVEKHDFVVSQYENGEYCLVDKNNTRCQINKEIFDYIYDWIVSINKIDNSKQIKPADENARRILIEDARDKLKKMKRRKNKKKDDESDLFGNAMSSVCFGGNGCATPFTIMDYKIFWLLENHSVIAKKQRANNLFRGIYAGTVGLKDIDKNELDWMS